MAQEQRIGVDIGGTFTDAVARTPAGLRVAKVPSAAQPVRSVLAAVAALRLEGAPEHLLHGTTLVTNMLLERKGAPTGFITSEGMRDLLHIGRHERPLTYAIRQEVPQQHHPPVPRRLRLTVPERVAADGSVVTPLDEKDVRAATRQLVAAGVEAIAIGFLHAYRYPNHELAAAEWVRSEAPDAFVCTSSQVSPRFREYERFLTTAWNARTAPAVTRYLDALAGEIDRLWSGVTLTLMTSNGGLEEIAGGDVPPGDLRRTPIRLALSGPAAAGNAVAYVARELRLRHCVGLDVGGTSSDIIVVRDGRLHEAPPEERGIGGYPLQIPMLDLHTIGAGGGSLLYRDAFGALHVGPESAGADPGPACYGRGGERPTVTDAAVVVGRLPPDVRLGGTMPLHPARAWAAMAATFGREEDGVVGEALDALALAEANIAFAIRERTVARGLNPADLALIVAGGAGPLLACGVADALELAEVIVPPHPGLLAAWGLLVAPERREAVLTVLRMLDDITPAEAEAFFEKGEGALAHTPPSGAEVRRTASLRYLGQGFEVEIPADDPGDVAGLASAFHAAHEREYGFALPETRVEWIELRVAWERPAPAWSFPEPAGSAKGERQTKSWERRAGGESTPVTARLLERQALAPGTAVTGPAIVLEKDATIYVPTHWGGKVTEGGYLRLRREGQTQGI